MLCIKIEDKKTIRNLQFVIRNHIVCKKREINLVVN
jgi:hypothetical protein